MVIVLNLHLCILVLIHRWAALLNSSRIRSDPEIFLEPLIFIQGKISTNAISLATTNCIVSLRCPFHEIVRVLAEGWEDGWFLQLYLLYALDLLSSVLIYHWDSYHLIAILVVTNCWYYSTWQSTSLKRSWNMRILVTFNRIKIAARMTTSTNRVLRRCNVFLFKVWILFVVSHPHWWSFHRRMSTR